MSNNGYHIDRFFLYPAALYTTDSECVVTTVLGSCVSVCLFDNINSFGGINHYMLPYWNGQGLASPKYGNIAIPRLIEKLISMGSKKNHLVAKVFGGGEVIETSSQIFNIGYRNIALAEEILHKYDIPVIAKSTGGKYGRKITFNTKNGIVKQKMISSARIDIRDFNPVFNTTIKKVD